MGFCGIYLKAILQWIPKLLFCKMGLKSHVQNCSHISQGPVSQCTNNVKIKHQIQWSRNDVVIHVKAKASWSLIQPFCLHFQYQISAGFEYILEKMSSSCQVCSCKYSELPPANNHVAQCKHRSYLIGLLAWPCLMAFITIISHGNFVYIIGFSAVNSVLHIYSAPSHYLNQCWVIVNWTLRNKLNQKLY